MLSLRFTRIYIRVGAGTFMGVMAPLLVIVPRKKVSGSCPYPTEPMGSHT